MVNKITNIKERVVQLAEYKGVTKEVFFEKIGSTSANFRGKAKSTPLNSAVIENIFSEFPDLSLEWLLTGKGNMLREYHDEDRQEEAYKIQEKYVEKNIDLTERFESSIPLIPVEAMAGYANGDTQVMEYEIKDRYVIPDFENKGVSYLIRASGSSMYPKYSNGDILACRPITDITFIQWGKVYVLDTDQGPIVKRLFECDNDPACLECRSDNKDRYPPFRIQKSSIRGVAIVVGVIRLE